MRPRSGSKIDQHVMCANNLHWLMIVGPQKEVNFNLNISIIRYSHFIANEIIFIHSVIGLCVYLFDDVWLSDD